MDSRDHTTQKPPLLVAKHDALPMLGNICMRTLEKVIANNELPVKRIGRRIFIPYRALVAFAQTGIRRADPAKPGRRTTTRDKAELDCT